MTEAQQRWLDQHRVVVVIRLADGSLDVTLKSGERVRVLP